MEDRDFNFPFEPYDIQSKLMVALYECIDQGKIGIFESPTGTGKSLSLICASLTWLREQQRRDYDVFVRVENTRNEPDWMTENLRLEKKQQALRIRQALTERLNKARARNSQAKQRHENGQAFGKRTKRLPAESQSTASTDDDSQFELDDYNSDDQSNASRQKPSSLGLSSKTQALLNKLGGGNDDDVENPESTGLKIIYSSRTHSQLTQFANELKRVKLPPVVDDDTDASPSTVEQLKHLTLGSRKNLCINPRVSKLKAISAINEACLELQKSGTAVDKKCAFLPSQENEHLVSQFRDQTLADIRDIEDLAETGKQLAVCPYYASRAAIPESEIITLPYPLLLQDSARESLGIKLDNHVVIIDEAHNLIDAICGIYSCAISLSQLQLGREQVVAYLKRFQNKLKGKNRVYVTQVVRLIDCLINYLSNRQRDQPPRNDGEARLSEIMSFKGVDQINLFKLATYIQESKLARKVEGYISKTAVKEKQPTIEEELPNSPNSTPVLMQIQTFMLALMNPASEGRFFYAIDGQQVSLSYMLLDAAPHFRSIVSSARSVILAGGTMSPMEDYIDYLFLNVDKARIVTLSCGHIVPPSSLVVYPVSRAGSFEFDFTFEKREKAETIIAAGKALLQIIPKVPDGVVVFFPSYAYMEKCQRLWGLHAVSGEQTSLLAAMRRLKPLFSESKVKPTSSDKPSSNTTTESILSAYVHAVRNPARAHMGATLFAILSGSLSEGINFSDALGRCVVVVGLPFPNPHSATWRAKRAYISARATAAGRAGDAVAAEYYLNTTMRAVNQAVGRAIRHRLDYASVVLLDKRYESARVLSKLSSWMSASLQKQTTGVGGVVQGLEVFFRQKQAESEKA